MVAIVISAFIVGTVVVGSIVTVAAHRRGKSFLFRDTSNDCVVVSIVGATVGLMLGVGALATMSLLGHPVSGISVRQEANIIADDPKAWVCDRVKDVERLSIDGIVLVIDRKIAEFEDMAKLTDDAERLASYGSAIGALKRERMDIARLGLGFCPRGN